eukprot:6186-Heterococcus_DN1.PRE.5
MLRRPLIAAYTHWHPYCVTPRDTDSVTELPVPMLQPLMCTAVAVVYAALAAAAVQVAAAADSVLQLLNLQQLVLHPLRQVAHQSQS